MRASNRVVAIVVAVGLGAAVWACWSNAALAHVSVVPSSAPKGGFEILSFSVPNEKDDANTVKLEVTLPTKNPVPFVSVKPMAGWTIATEKTKLAKAVSTDDGNVTEAVTKITWTATAGGLEPGQFDLFTVSAGPLPTKGSKIVFKALQTYSDGDVVRWIEPVVKGTPEPDFPAPTLTLTKTASGHGH
jgi:uncharacterized protein YcnI